MGRQTLGAPLAQPLLHLSHCVAVSLSLTLVMWEDQHTDGHAPGRNLPDIVPGLLEATGGGKSLTCHSRPLSGGPCDPASTVWH